MTMTDQYRLSAVLAGHSQDVRGVSCIDAQTIITASRDHMAKVWRCGGKNAAGDLNYIADLTLTAHSHFVAAVTFLPPSAEFRKGRIASAGHDKIVYIYDVNDSLNTEPVFSCIGHEDVCCCVSPASDGRIVSGSWDKTAKVWDNGKCLATLKGHEFAVWAVLGMPNGDILTGSADKTIKLWRDGNCIHTIKAHTDCVRGLSLIPGIGFASCGNDGVVKVWNMSLDCIQELHGHTAFVYAVTVLPNGNFASCGEDRTVRVWHGNECIQTIPIPCSSVWSVCALPNGDIVVGCSDGMARVFSTAESRFASESLVREFEEQVASFAIPAQQIGDIKKDELQSEESLKTPGTRDGMTKMVKTESGAVFAYQWDGGQAKWTKIGEVVNAVGNADKQLLNGVEYDYVFDIDVGDGAPNRKLGYNSSENPYVAAQRFIHEQEIGQHFLDQIAEFITQNAKTVTIGQGEQQSGDPFTGAGRYIPGSGNGMFGQGNGVGADPFTGGVKYNPAYNEDQSPNLGTSAATAKAGSFHSNTVFISFKTAKHEGICSKLKEFNGQTKNPLGESELMVLVEVLDGLLAGVSDVEKLAYDALANALRSWEANYLFPILDVYRLLSAETTPCQYFAACLKHGTFNIIEALESAVSRTASTKFAETNKMLVLRSFCNMFCCSQGRQMMWDSYTHTFGIIGQAMGEASKVTTQQAIASLLLNYSTLLHFEKKLDSEFAPLLLTYFLKGLDVLSDPESIYRCLLGLVTLVNESDIASSDNFIQEVKAKAMKFKVSENEKIKSCASSLASL
eukprot:Nk52_evm7s1224 gene=Nk52_evmTU7s1224